MDDAPAERGTAGWWGALRRRKVVQWGLLYIAVAWGFLQGLEYIGNSFNWPQQVRQIAVLAFVVGLPSVLVLAWYHGDRGEQRVRGSGLAIVTLLLLLGGGTFWYYQRANEAATVAAPEALRSPEIATDASIAVLPFVNMSADKEQEYFADGIAREATRPYTPAALQEGITLYQQALAIDSNYVPAWDGLADTYLGELYLGSVLTHERLPLARGNRTGTDD